VSIHFLVRFEPRPGKETQFREELLRVVDPSRAEIGCLAIHVFESLREPPMFAIHSEWVDEAAFELHARLPHTVRFLQAAKELLTHPVEGLRSREIGGGAGAGAGGV
jgi:quinol monooxygenase YgiN